MRASRFSRCPVFVLVLCLAVSIVPFADRLTAQQVFRARRDVVSVDVVVRDRAGNVVRGLTTADFELLEDGRPQQIETFTFQEIKAGAPVTSTNLLSGVEDRVLSGTSADAAPAEPVKFTADELAGRRLVILLFDLSSMEPDDVQRSIDAAAKYVDEQMTTADLVAVATVGSALDVLVDFTGDRARVAEVLKTLAYTEGTATPPPDASTAASDDAAAAAAEETTAAAEVNELDLFNNDVRLRALKTLADTLQAIEQKKAIVYFSAGMQRTGADNQVELRAAINSAVRANVSIYPVDTRGLTAIVPGGDARGGGGGRGGGRGGGGRGLFSGAAVAQQFASLARSQDSLTTLARDTGGQAFTDSNDFSGAFRRVIRDMSAYYILGYSSTNAARDGRFRRIQVRLKNPADRRVEARAGYYAERDFAHTSRGDREAQLEAELMAAVSSTALPVVASAAYFRLAPDKFYVPISLAIPGAAVPVAAGKDKVSIDVLGMVFDEAGRPIGRIRQTLTLPVDQNRTLGQKQVLYQSGLTLPPGRFGLKVVVRENETGLTGSFEAPVRVPALAAEPLKVSAVVLSSQLQPAPRGRSDNPLVRDGVQLLPNLTRVVSRDQKLFFYYEVYDPALVDGKTPALRTSLAFYRGKVKVMETPVVSRTVMDAPDRRAVLFQFEVPAEHFLPGLYTCQLNIIDEAAGTFAFPRLDLFIR